MINTLIVGFKSKEQTNFISIKQIPKVVQHIVRLSYIKIITLLSLSIIAISLSITIVNNNITSENPFLPSTNGQVKGLYHNSTSLKLAILPQIIQISNGSTFHLTASKVIKKINGSNIVAYGLNGQVPGPTIKVKQGSSIFVNFTNNIIWIVQFIGMG